jgi:hypothetical protein
MRRGICRTHEETRKAKEYIFSEKLKRKDCLGDVGVDWRIVVKPILNK